MTHQAKKANMLHQFRQLLAKAQRVVVLTGAGVSAESGLLPAGPPARYDATMLATPQAFVRDPSLVWEFYHWRREVVSQCKPNPGHVALAAYERRAAELGQSFVLVTQNIDRLHQAAGSKNVIELHGSLWDVCVATPAGFRDPGRPPWEDRRQPLVPALASTGDPEGQPAEIPVEELPHDDEGRLLRPGVVWFNENLDDAVIDAVDDGLEATDLLIIVGTSSVVYPAAGYAPQCARRGVPVVEVNLEPTDNSSVCRLSIQGRAGKLLPELFGVADDPAVAAAIAERSSSR